MLFGWGHAFQSDGSPCAQESLPVLRAGNRAFEILTRLASCAFAYTKDVALLLKSLCGVNFRDARVWPNNVCLGEKTGKGTSASPFPGAFKANVVRSRAILSGRNTCAPKDHSNETSISTQLITALPHQQPAPRLEMSHLPPPELP